MKIMHCMVFPALLLTTAMVSAQEPGIISGIVSNSSGEPQRAIFVQARNTGTRKGVTVLTNNAGEYRIDDLDAGEYTLLIDWQIDDLAKQEIIGVRPELAGEQLDTGQKLTRDFTLDPRPPKWTELSFVQYRELLPERTGKSETLGGCAQCHGFRWQSLHPRNDIAWSETIDWVVNSYPYHFDTGFYQMAGVVTPKIEPVPCR